MTREIIFLHVGQCGNQLGYEFWSVAIKEYFENKQKLKDINDSMSSFFEYMYDDTENMKARALLIDTEIGVTNEIQKSNISAFINENNIFNEQSGSGNNWSQGLYYGQKYHNILHDLIQKNIEKCDSLQSFYLTFSLGGGTGSGLSSSLLELLNDNYNIIKFSNCIFPSHCDDVITSPYNSIFALNKIHEYSNCILPVSNDALLKILNNEKLNNYSEMNNIVANVIINLTSSMRFEGSLNVDINEICTNLIPYPYFNFLLSSLSPCIQKQNIRTFDHLFKDVLNVNNQMLIANPKDGLNLSTAFLVRGNVNISDITKNVLQTKKNLKILSYNKDATKIGLCNVKPLNQPYSLLCLMNSCEIRNTFFEMLERFNKLFRRKAHLHHYLEYITLDDILEYKENIKNLIYEYNYMQKHLFCSPKFLNKNTLNLLGYKISEENENKNEQKNNSNLYYKDTLIYYPPFLKSFIKNRDKKLNWYDFQSKPII